METLEKVDYGLAGEGVRGEVQDLEWADSGDALQVLLQRSWDCSYQILMDVKLCDIGVDIQAIQEVLEAKSCQLVFR